MVWAAFCENIFRVRLAGLGAIVGIELDTPLRQLDRAGVDPDVAEELLRRCEIAFIAARSRKDAALAEHE
jgi:hypothetical protein